MKEPISFGLEQFLVSCVGLRDSFKELGEVISALGLTDYHCPHCGTRLVIHSLDNEGCDCRLYCVRCDKYVLVNVMSL